MDESGTAEARIPLLTEESEDKFVAPAPLNPGLWQTGIDDITLARQVDRRAIPRIQDRWLRDSSKTPWGSYPLGYAGSYGRFHDLLNRHKVFWRPESCRLFIQAKFAPRGRLLPADVLPDAVRNLEVSLAYHGVLLDEGDAWSVGRLDVAADLVMRSASAGKLLLDALAAVRLPGGLYSDRVGQQHPTVYHRLPKSGKKHARSYSRHRETGLEAFRVIRLERQQLYKPRLPMSDVTAAYARQLWLKHYAALVPPSGRVTVGQQEQVIMRLVEKVEAGEIAFGKFEQAIGYLQAEKMGLAESMYPAKRLQERRRLCRDLGLSLESVGVDALDVELGDLLAPVMTEEGWAKTSG